MPDKNAARGDRLKNAVAAGAVYFLFLFVTTTSVLLLYYRIRQQIPLFSSISLVFGAIGYLFFARVRFSPRAAAFGRRLTAFDCALFLLAFAVCLFGDAQFGFPLFHILFSLSYGYLGGFAHFTAFRLLRGNPFGGRAIGFGAGLAVLAQQLLLNKASGAAFPFAVTALAAALLAFFVEKNALCGDPLHAAPVGQTAGKRGCMLIVQVALMACAVGAADGIIAQLRAAGLFAIASYPRAFYGVGLVLAGLLADGRDRRYLNISTIAAMLLLALAPLFMKGVFLGSNYGHSFYYIFSGFFVIYITLSFFDVAEETGNPPLWASMGRVTHALAGGATGYCLSHFFADTSVGVLYLFCVACSMSSVLFFFLNDGKHRTTAADNGEGAFAAQYGLTSREAEVLRHIVNSDEPLREIAPRLSMTERRLQKHLGKIYAKTATSSRAALVSRFHEKRDAS